VSQQIPDTPSGDAHAAAGASSITGFVVWLLSTYLFHGGPVPPEITGFVLVVVTYTSTWLAARLVQRRRAAKTIVGEVVPAPSDVGDPQA
jgi:uncharacterized membrane protein YfcA